jgi:MFS family permease
MKLRIWVLIIYGAVTMFITGMIGPVMPLFLRSVGFPVAEMGVIISVAGLTSAAMSLFAGNLADRFNRTKLFLAGAVIFLLIPLGYYWARQSGIFIALRLSEGLLVPLAGVASQAMLIDLARAAGRRGEVMGTARSLRSAMFVIGPTVGGVLITALAVRDIFLVEFAMLLMLTGLAFAVLRRETAPEPRKVPIFAPPQLLRDRTVLALLAILLLDFLNFQVLLFVFPLYGKSIGIAAWLIGALITVQSAAYAIVQKPVGKLGDQGRLAPLLAGCAVLGGPLIFSLSLTTSPVLLGIVMMLVGLASAPIFLAVTLLVADAAGENTGVAMGLISAIVYIAAGLAPLFAGLLGGLRLQDAFLVPVGSSLLAVPLLYGALRRRHREAVASADTAPVSDLAG